MKTTRPSSPAGFGSPMGLFPWLRNPNVAPAAGVPSARFDVIDTVRPGRKDTSFGGVPLSSAQRRVREPSGAVASAM